MRAFPLAVVLATAFALTPSFAFGEEFKNVQLPDPIVGADVIGKRIPLEEMRWLNTKNRATPKTDGRITLVRWWTDSCPYCATSLPAINGLDLEYADQGFQTIAVYHPKPPRDVENETVLQAAKRIEYEGAVAIDDDWAVLRKIYLDTGNRGATSVSFLLDGEGKIRYLHPGPELRPGKGPRESSLQRQYDEMRQAIEALLAEDDSNQP